jgi:two-component system chemotaxis response regulator CheY
MAKYRALIVDDSPTMRQFIAMSIKRVGDISHDQAQNGVEALMLLKKAKYDIALLDINMPELDGVRLLQMIRADSDHASMAVVMISTEGSSETQEHLRSLGANAYLTKPVASHLVTDIVKKLLSDK